MPPPSPASPTSGPKKPTTDKDRVTQWVAIANDWLANPKSDSSMLMTCCWALQLKQPELAEKCKIEAQRRHKTIKH